MLGLVVAEVCVAALIDQAYSLGTLTGFYEWTGDDPVIEAAFVIAAKLLSFGAVTAFVLRRSHESWRSLGHVGFSPFILAIAFLPIIAGTTIFLSEIDNLLRAYLPANVFNGWDFAPELEHLMSAPWVGPSLAVIIAPVTEEVIFRGLILRGFLGRWKPWTAIIASAALFALMHFNPAQTPVALGLGLVLGWIYVRTRSLGLCMLGHAVNNSASYPLSFFPFQIQGFNADADIASQAAIFHPWWFDVTGVGLFLGGLWLIHRFAPAAEPWHVSPVLVPPLLGQSPSAHHNCLPPLLANTSPSMSAELVVLVTSLAQRARFAPPRPPALRLLAALTSSRSLATTRTAARPRAS